MLTNEELEFMAARINSGANFEYPPSVDVSLFSARYNGKVYSKGRPRFSGKGHAFTPENTRKFEKALVKFYWDQKPELAFCPITVYIVLFDKLPKSAGVKTKLLADQRLVYSSTGDVDNRAKSILDAGNGILFEDDSQIVQLNIRRMYHEEEGFSIELYRSGLSANEAHNIGNFLK